MKRHTPKTNKNEVKANNDKAQGQLFFFQFSDKELHEMFPDCIFPCGESLGDGGYWVRKCRGLS